MNQAAACLALLAGLFLFASPVFAAKDRARLRCKRVHIAVQDDAQAEWTSLYNRLAPPLRNALKARVHDEHAREDLVQDTLLSLYTGGKEPRQITFGLAMTTASRRIIDQLRGNKEVGARPFREFEDENGTRTEDFAEPEVREHLTQAERELKRALDQLSPKHYRVFHAISQGQTPPEAAASCTLHRSRASAADREKAAHTAVRLFDESLIHVLRTLPKEEFNFERATGGRLVHVTEGELGKALEAFNEKERQIARLIFIDGFNLARAAREVGMDPTGTRHLMDRVGVALGREMRLAPLRIHEVSIIGVVREAPPPAPAEPERPTLEIRITAEELRREFRGVEGIRRKILELHYVQSMSTHEAAHKANATPNDVHSVVNYVRRVLRDQRGRREVKVGDVRVIVTDAAPRDPRVDPWMWIAPENAIKIPQAEFDRALATIQDPRMRIAVRMRVTNRWTLAAIAEVMHLEVVPANRILIAGLAELRTGLGKNFRAPREILVVP